MFKRPILIVTFAIVAVGIALTASILLSQRNEKVALTSTYANSQQVVEMLNNLDVASESNQHYLRENFGDEFHNGTCKATRVQVLIQENHGQFGSNSNCSEMHGRWQF